MNQIWLLSTGNMMRLIKVEPVFVRKRELVYFTTFADSNQLSFV